MNPIAKNAIDAWNGCARIGAKNNPRWRGGYSYRKRYRGTLAAHVSIHWLPVRVKRFGHFLLELHVELKQRAFWRIAAPPPELAVHIQMFDSLLERKFGQRFFYKTWEDPSSAGIASTFTFVARREPGHVDFEYQGYIYLSRTLSNTDLEVLADDLNWKEIAETWEWLLEKLREWGYIPPSGDARFFVPQSELSEVEEEGEKPPSLDDLSNDASVKVCIDFYHKCLESGLRVTFYDIARQSNRSAGALRNKHEGCAHPICSERKRRSDAI